MGRCVALLLWAAAALSIATASASRLDASNTRAHPLRGLLAANGFPWCQCQTYDCKCSPYKLVLQESTKLNATTTRTCFSISYIGCDTSRDCCRGLLGSVDKLSLDTTVPCGNKANILKVTVNGATHLSWRPYDRDTGYEFKIYDLGMNNATFSGSKICITTKTPCASSGDLCTNSAAPSKGCRYSFADTSATNYCPICSTVTSLPPPPPPPSPPPPPPPPPPSPPPPSPPPPP
ncbi:hypothetical protein Agub_g11011, partial [Astrephomene gubernaculifera]